MDIKLKVCGMRDPQNIEALTGLSPDYMGFIFYDRSQRFVADLDPTLLLNLPASIKTTGVFVNSSIENVLETVSKYKLKALQLHGSESADYCKLVKIQFPDLEIIKAFGVNDNFNFEQLDNYVDSMDFFLFDTQTEAHGGSGKTFNWQLLSQYQLQVPYFLSGGIGLEQLQELKQIVDPRLYAVDVNSRFETAPAMKDIDQLRTFKNQL